MALNTSFSPPSIVEVRQSDNNPTEVKQYASKHQIELYLKGNAAGSGMGWTILRPVAFMGNFTPDVRGKGFLSMWEELGDKGLQLISTHDIGVLAAGAFSDPAKYHGRAISLAGDDLTLDQAKKIFKDTVGHEMAENFNAITMAPRHVHNERAMMLKWLKEVGFGAEIEELRKEEPELEDFAKWLKERLCLSSRRVRNVKKERGDF